MFHDSYGMAFHFHFHLMITKFLWYANNDNDKNIVNQFVLDTVIVWFFAVAIFIKDFVYRREPTQHCSVPKNIFKWNKFHFQPITSIIISLLYLSNSFVLYIFISLPIFLIWFENLGRTADDEQLCFFVSGHMFFFFVGPVQQVSLHSISSFAHLATFNFQIKQINDSHLVSICCAFSIIFNCRSKDGDFKRYSFNYQ